MEEIEIENEQKNNNSKPHDPDKNLKKIIMLLREEVFEQKKVLIDSLHELQLCELNYNKAVYNRNKFIELNPEFEDIR